MSSKIKDLTNCKFGKLTILEKVASSRSGSILWTCKCECGTIKQYSSDHLTRKSNPVKSCGCYRKSLIGKNHYQWGGFGEISGNWWYNHVTRERKQKYRTKIKVEITIEYAWNLFLQQNKKCNLSGLELKFGSSSHSNTASLDRIDSSKGYIEGNVQWVHKHINFMKRTYSQQYFIQMCNLVVNNSKNGGQCEIT